VQEGGLITAVPPLCARTLQKRASSDTIAISYRFNGRTRRSLLFCKKQKFGAPLSECIRTAASHRLAPPGGSLKRITTRYFFPVIAVWLILAQPSRLVNRTARTFKKPNNRFFTAFIIRLLHVEIRQNPFTNVTFCAIIMLFFQSNT